MKKILLYLGIVSVFYACDEPYTLDLDQTPPIVVIEGLVTDRPGLQYVKVSRTVDFYADGQTPRVTNAVVTVRDDLGSTTTFVHNPRNHKDSAGYYLPASTFAGTLGRTYALRVEVDGIAYDASDKLTNVIPMDSLSYKVNQWQFQNPEVPGRIYEVLVFATEPQDEVNFYLFKFYRNDSLTYAGETDIYISDDEFLAENIDGVPTPIYYSKGDTAMVEAYSISRVGYVYYNDLIAVLNNDAGGMFGPVASSPRTNLSNGAVGFFQVSAVNRREIIVE